MDPQVAAILTGLMPMLEGIVALGIPGLLLGMAAIPAIVIALICWLNYRHDQQTKKTLEAYRQDTREILQSLADKHDECIREFQQRHDESLAEFREKHQQVVTFYSNNVTLVKSHEKLAEANQALIVNNTRAMEHLSVMIETLAKNQGR